jgi:aminodeoxyfutalosine synthase
MNVAEKIRTGERINFEEALSLYEMDLFELGELANKRRLQLHGKKSYFNINRHINPTNICKDVCKFCAYSASRKNPKPYTLKHEEIMAIVDDIASRGIRSIFSPSSTTRVTTRSSTS